MKENEIRKRRAFNQYLKLVEKDVGRFFKNRASFVKINCPACGNKKNKKEFEKLGFQYVSCLKCGTLFVNPRPNFENLKKFYTQSPSTKFWINKFFKPVAQIRREKIFQPRTEYIKNNFPDYSGAIIGDIGAGFGIFLEELSKFWPRAKLIAIEPSLEMTKICAKKGLQVIPKSLEEVEGWNNRFDLLCAFELFEHLHNPGEFLKKAWSLLKPGGHLFLTTLNNEGFDIQVLWEKSKSVSPPHHLNFFNPDSIKLLLKSKGFKLKEITTPGKLDWDIIEEMYKNKEANPDRFWRLVSEKADQRAKDNLQVWLSESGFSSHMRILAQKEK